RAQPAEEPQERGCRQEQRHADATRPQEERRSLHEIRRLEEDRVEVARQVERREEAAREEDVALRELHVPDVEQRAPPQQVEPEIDEGEGHTAEHYTGERSRVRCPGAPCKEQRERGRGGGDGKTREGCNADARADQPRALPARCEEERG